MRLKILSFLFGNKLKSANLIRRKLCVNINPNSVNYLEDLYNAWVKNPTSVDPSWASYFQDLAAGGGNYPRKHFTAYIGKNEMYLDEYLQKRGSHQSASVQQQPEQSQLVTSYNDIEDYSAVKSLVRNFQDKGYLAADVDPLKYNITDQYRIAKIEKMKKDARFYRRGLGQPQKMERMYTLPNSTFIGPDQMKLSDILERCQEIYTNNIGAEFYYIKDYDKIDWIKERLEIPGIQKLTKQRKIKCWERLVRTTIFESFLAKKWSAEKRFGIEGCDMLIPALKEIIDYSTGFGVESVNIGMAHRGRLNTLVNVCRKPLYQLFVHFVGLEIKEEGAGDVKYHLGTSSNVMNRAHNKTVRIAMLANASHLEHVNPAVLGKCRAEQFFKGDCNGDKVLPILIHGDSSFSGQGIVFESIQLSDLPHFTPHGVIHVVVNNQLGYTTEPQYYKSSSMCTDVARVINAPIFHVNADNPEAVCHVCKVAAEWRKTFKSCVVIDLVGYRRNGHNEQDEPSFTQPLQYNIIRQKKPVLYTYTEKLIKEGIITKQRSDEYTAEYEKILDTGLEDAKKETHVKLEDWLDSPWIGHLEGDKYDVKSTGVDEKTLKHIATMFSSHPPDDLKFVTHKAIDRILKQRKEMVEKRVTDWALGEALALGSLLKEGIHIQFTGQDVERGTFSHRHHVLHHQEKDMTYNALEHLYPDQAKYLICNSSLSEGAVLGFQLGYSTHNPKCFVMWEAQFADFANTAQAVVDTLITSGQTKWYRQSGLVMLLPHGFEGMGPEHSSGRIERYLDLCDDDPDTIPPLDDPKFGIKQLHYNNVILANVTTPANLFHIWRRQLYMNFRKPLVMFTPKFILRHPEARSGFDEMIEGTCFQTVYPDKATSPSPKKLIFCSGKVYYDLKQEREKRKLIEDIALVRIEQYCPFPYDMVKKELDKYPNSQVAWAQEEHKFQGAWNYVYFRLNYLLGNKKELTYIGRPSSASAAAGNKYLHDKEVVKLYDDAMKL